MKFYSTFLAAFILLFTSKAEDDDYCYDNLNDISNAEIRLVTNGGDTSVIRQYILCPHTDYKIGQPTSDGLTYQGGSLPLVVLSPNMQVICGRDGSPDNRCSLVGGDHQVISSSPSFLPEALDGLVPDATNFVLQGVTLKGATDIDMSFASRGSNILIENCIFKDSVKGQFSVYIDSPVAMDENLGGGRHLEEGLIYIPPDSLVLPELDVTLRNCQFEFNRKTMAIVASVGNAIVIIEDSKFKDNSIPGRDDLTGSILWMTEGGGLIVDNCFKDNTYGLAPILVNRGDFTQEGNFVDDKPRLQELGCDNYMVVPDLETLGTALNDKDYECTEFTTTTCRAQEYETPSKSSAVRNSVFVVVLLSLVGALLCF